MASPGVAIDAVKVPLFAFFISMATKPNMVAALEYLSNGTIQELNAENMFQKATCCPWVNAVIQDMYSDYMSGGDVGALASIDNYMQPIKTALFTTNIDKNTPHFITLTRLAFFACSTKNTLLPVDERIIKMATESYECITGSRCDALDILINLPEGTSRQTFALHGIAVY